MFKHELQNGKNITFSNVYLNGQRHEAIAYNLFSTIHNAHVQLTRTCNISMAENECEYVCERASVCVCVGSFNGNKLGTAA